MQKMRNTRQPRILPGVLIGPQYIWDEHVAHPIPCWGEVVPVRHWDCISLGTLLATSTAPRLQATL